MRYDRRQALPEQPVATGNPAVDDALNTQLQALRGAVRRLQEGVVIEPVTVEPERPYTGQLAVCDGEGWDYGGDGAPRLLCYLGDAWVALTP